MEDMQIHGLDELRRALKRLPEKVAQKHLKKSTSQAATLVVRAAKGLVPVNTGLVKSSIKKKAMRSPVKTQATTGIGVLAASKKVRAKKNLGDPYYWKFVEFGTSKMPARPFLRPAFESVKYAAADKIKQVLILGIEKEARK